MRQASLLLFFILISACNMPQASSISTGLPPASVQVNSSTISPAPSAQVPITVQPDVERSPSEYVLDVSFDYANHSLQVHEGIIYSNNSQDSINEMQFVVEARRLGAGFSLTDLELDGGTPAGEPEFSGEILRVFLQNPLSRGEKVQIELDYELVLPAGAGTLSWTDRQTNFIDWYPYIPPYVDSQGWLVHEAASVGEHEVFESANFKVHIEVSNAPASLQIAAA